MILKRFSRELYGRLVWILLTMTALVGLGMDGRFRVVLLLMILALGGQIYALIRQLQRTNRELDKFLNAVRHADFTQRFSLEQQGVGYDELGESFNDVLERFREVRGEREEQARYLQAVLEHVPIALISTKGDGRLKLLNNAARKIFRTAQPECLHDLAAYGKEFSDHVSSLVTGERTVTHLRVEGETMTVAIAVTEMRLRGVWERLFSLQSIQSEMEAVELEAWQSLVRVLTHEIMNSLTPVASLTKTAEGILAEAREMDSTSEDYEESLDDVEGALKTVARRSGNLMHFIQNYRKITRLPPPEPKLLKLEEVFASIEALITAHWGTRAVTLSHRVIPSSLQVVADPEFIEQALINLLKNAGEAVEGQIEAHVHLAAHLDGQGRVVVEVSDNGKGFEKGDLADAFVPFFTSKRGGSGIGLALVRQIMLAHGGTVSAGNRPQGGALLKMIFGQ